MNVPVSIEFQIKKVSLHTMANLKSLLDISMVFAYINIRQNKRFIVKVILQMESGWNNTKMMP